MTKLKVTCYNVKLAGLWFFVKNSNFYISYLYKSYQLIYSIFETFFFYLSLSLSHTHTHQGLHKRSTNSNNLFHKSKIKIITRKYGVKYYIPLFNKHISQIIQRIINLYHDSLINDKSLCALSLFLFWFDCFTVLEIIYNANFKNLCIY